MQYIKSKPEGEVTEKQNMFCVCKKAKYLGFLIMFPFSSLILKDQSVWYLSLPMLLELANMKTFKILVESY